MSSIRWTEQQWMEAQAPRVVTGAVIGIDPDIDESGIAHLKDRQLLLSTMPFCKLQDYLKSERPNIREVVIEAGWLNAKSNFHGDQHNSKVTSKIGSYTGANAQVGKLLEETCKHYGIPYRLVRPLRKIWGKKRQDKISHDEFVEHVQKKGVVWKPSTTNPEKRDAALLIL